MSPKAKPPEIWDVRFFRRHADDDHSRACPGLDFLQGIDARVAKKFRNILRSVALAPPPTWTGGGTWEAMHEDMAGYYEVRTEPGDWLYRLFCILERDAEGLSGPSIVVIAGLKKRKRTKVRPEDYASVRKLGGEYRQRSPRSVF